MNRPILITLVAITSCTLRAQAVVQTGLDRLVATKFESLRGAKVGLISNQTGRDAQGRGIVDDFLAQDACTLRAIFSPEHGFDGVLDQAKITDGRHASGIVIHSLYGETRKPTATMLDGIDTLVFDIQDVGTRFYTYAATMRLCMEAAAENHIAFVVLDRPNPIGGIAVDGPLLDAGKESFVAPHLLPVRHGMTLGELARMFDAERAIGCEPRVIEVQGWNRAMLWEDTGLTWVNPSPNMRTPTQALLYPGIGLLETTDLSVGRGTDTPFEIVGAPWFDGPRVWARLRELELEGVAFTPVRFTPTSSKHEGKECGGLRIAVTDRSRLDPLRIGLALAVVLHDLHREDFRFAPFARLLGNQACFDALDRGASAGEVIAAWQKDLDAFRTRRAKYLIYR
ncbi:MAG: DUF1343 domain-containing protein [Planctomycetota bacterium]